MHLLHFNMTAVSICCLLLLGGFSYRQSKPGVWAMLAGALGLLAIMAINIPDLPKYIKKKSEFKGWKHHFAQYPLGHCAMDNRAKDTAEAGRSPFSLAHADSQISLCAVQPSQQFPGLCSLRPGSEQLLTSPASF